MKDLKILSDLNGPSGFEDEVASYVFKVFSESKNVKKVFKDRIGNVFGIIPGKTDKKLMIAAHMDEVGFMVNYIDEKGFIRFNTIGGIVQSVLPNCRISLMCKDGNKIKGVIGVNPPHAKQKTGSIDIKDLFIDTGFNKAELIEKGIDIGSTGVFDTQFEDNGKVFIGKAFDDRIGVSVLLDIAKDLSSKPDFTIILCASVQEEVGMRGITVALNDNPVDYALIFEGTFAMDYPGNRADDYTSYFGSGPAITIMDGTMISDRKFLACIEKIANKNKIKYQYKQPRNAGGTDAGKIHLSGNGVKCCVIAAPCRYIHSSYSMVHKEDYNNIKKLGKVLVKEIKVKEIENLYK